MSKNQTLPTVTEFRADFPQFQDETKFPTPVIEFRLGLADLILSETKHDTLFKYMVGLFVAHHLSLWWQDQREIIAGGAGGASKGVVSSKSVHDVSVSYDTSMTMNPDAGFWNLTRYGQEYWQCFQLFGMGGRQL